MFQTVETAPAIGASAVTGQPKLALLPRSMGKRPLAMQAEPIVMPLALFG